MYLSRLFDDTFQFFDTFQAAKHWALLQLSNWMEPTDDINVLAHNPEDLLLEVVTIDGDVTDNWAMVATAGSVVRNWFQRSRKPFLLVKSSKGAAYLISEQGITKATISETFKYAVYENPPNWVTAYLDQVIGTRNQGRF